MTPFKLKLWRQLFSVGRSTGAFLVLIICNIIYFLTYFSEKDLPIVNNFSVIRRKIWDGEYYRLITATFTHSNWLHLAFNCGVWLPYARSIELSLGFLPLLYLTICSGIFASSCQVAFDSNSILKVDKIHDDKPMIGLSGAIMSLMGFTISKIRFLYPTYFKNKIINNNYINYIHLRKLNFYLNRKFGLTTRLIGSGAIFAVLLNYFAPSISIANTAHVSGLLHGLFLGNIFYFAGANAFYVSSILSTSLAIFYAHKPTWSYKYLVWSSLKEFEQGNWMKAKEKLEKIIQRSNEKDQWAMALYALVLSQIPSELENAKQIALKVKLMKLGSANNLKELSKLLKNSHFDKRIVELHSKITRAQKGNIGAPSIWIKNEPAPVCVINDWEDQIKILKQQRSNLNNSIKELQQIQPYSYIDGEEVIYLFNSVFCRNQPEINIVNQRKTFVIK